MNNTAQRCRSLIPWLLMPLAFCFVSAQQTQLFAQVTATRSNDLEERQDFLGDRGTLYTMTIAPAAEPKPAFKYRLIVPQHKTIPGNAVTHYLRSFGEGSLSRPWDALADDFGYETVDSWYDLETPVGDIPIEGLKNASSAFDSYVNNYIRRATKCRDADWGLAVEDLKPIEFFSFMAPSLQQTRQIARVLMLRNRLAIIERRYEDSIEHIGMIYQLGDNVNEFGTAVACLVAASQVGMANDCMVELISSPNSPNMYWALAELPRPVLNIRRALRCESSVSQRLFPELDDIETGEYSEEEWNRRLTSAIDTAKEFQARLSSAYDNEPPRQMQSQSMAMAAGLIGYSSAKQRLLESGLEAKRVNEMCVSQVLLIDFKRDLDYFSHECEKAVHTPTKDLDGFEDRIDELLASSLTRPGAFFVSQLSNPVAAIRQVGSSLQVGVDSLMVIEAIRHHVATHGTLPESLEDLELPVRKNAFTGKPFGYRLENGKAVLDVELRNQKKRYAMSIAE